MTLGKRIAHALVDCDMTKRELANKSGVRDAMISKICKGERTPSLHTAKRIAKALNISLDELAEDLEGEEE